MHRRSTVHDGGICAASDPDTGSPPRTVNVLVGGVPTPVACPGWCHIDHSEEAIDQLSELSHSSAPVRVDTAVEAELHQLQGSDPRLLLWQMSSGTAAALDLDAAEQLLDVLPALVAQLRATQRNR